MQCTEKRERGVVAVVVVVSRNIAMAVVTAEEERQRVGGQSVSSVSQFRQSDSTARTPPSLDDRAGVFGPLNQQQQQKQRRLPSHARPLLN